MCQLRYFIPPTWLSSHMPQPSVNVDETLLDDFDSKMIRLKADGELDRSVSRSELIRRLMKEWVEERDDLPPE